jgi:hypothetical protein
MSRDLSINVNVNPNGAASPTQTRVTEAPESTEIQNRTAGNAIQAAAIISVVQRGARIATSNIGELTGNKSLERNARFVSNIATLGLLGFKNPVAALALATFQIGQAAAQASITNRNIEIQRDYNRQVRLATHNNSRR